MKFGKVNLIAGTTGLLLAALGGMALGATFDQYSIKDGNHILSEVRFYLREGHSHGMPIAMLNLIVGVLVDRLNLSDLLKRITGILAILAFMLPIGLAAKGAAGASPTFPPIGMVGVIGFVGCVVLLLIGSIRMATTRAPA